MSETGKHTPDNRVWILNDSSSAMIVNAFMLLLDRIDTLEEADKKARLSVLTNPVASVVQCAQDARAALAKAGIR